MQRDEMYKIVGQWMPSNFALMLSGQLIYCEGKSRNFEIKKVNLL